MLFCIQDPSYNKSLYLHESLLKECEDGIIGAGVYAFASKDGVYLFFSDDNFKKFMENGSFHLIVGMDDITNINTLIALKYFKEKYGKRLTIKAYVHDNKASTFHPKFSWFKKQNGGVLILGSGNLTQKGLRHNREAYNIIDYDIDGIKKVIDEWQDWVDHSKPFLFEIEDEITIAHAKENTVKTKAIFNAKTNVATSTSDDINTQFLDVFNSQPKDEKRNYKTNIKKAKTISTETFMQNTELFTDEGFDDDNSYWEFTLSSKTLIAEIPKNGDRLKQANFDKETFQNYFGATCGENGAYRILLKNIKEDGSLSKTEIRPSVSVKSYNYRFELEAARGLDYPLSNKRPIAVFVKISCRDFLYELIMPEDASYDEVLSLMNARQAYTNKMRRLIFDCNDIHKKTPSLNIWKRLRGD